MFMHAPPKYTHVCIHVHATYLNRITFLFDLFIQFNFIIGRIKKILSDPAVDRPTDRRGPYVGRAKLKALVHVLLDIDRSIDRVPHLRDRRVTLVPLPGGQAS